VSAAKPSTVLEIDGREVTISNPDKVLFPEAGHTKLDVVRYYQAVAGGALRAAGGRPNVLVRYPNGVGEEFFYQKRAPASRPEWVEVVSLRFPSGRSADEVVLRDAATLAWMANLGCLELHPHPVRADDLDHPDELRVDLDPVPGVPWSQLREVAGVVKATLDDMGLVGWPKTSGSRGIHVNLRLERRWGFGEVRRAALALSREVERRAPSLATSKWWKEERHGVFLDYNQNAKDRTVAAAYSVRHRRLSVLARPAARAVGSPGAGGAGGRALAAALPQAARRAAPRPAVQAACPPEGCRREEGGCQAGEGPEEEVERTACVQAPADRDRACEEEVGRARRARAVEGAPSGRGRSPGAGGRARRRDARALLDLDAHPREPAARAPGDQAASGAARPGRRAELDVASGSLRHEARRRTAIELHGRRNLLHATVPEHGDAVAEGHGLLLVLRHVERGDAQPAIEARQLGACMLPPSSNRGSRAALDRDAGVRAREGRQLRADELALLTDGAS
jgi:DNA ligase D-like protein (predicted polymerase)